MVAVHARRQQAGEYSTIDEHLQPNAHAYLKKTPSWCRQQAEGIGSDCLALIEHLFADTVLDQLRAAQGIINLAKGYGKVRLNAACRRAMIFNSYHYKTVKAILKNGTEYDTLPNEQAFDLYSQAYTQGRFLRQSISPTIH